MAGRSDNSEHDGDEPTAIASPRVKHDTRRRYDAMSTTPRISRSQLPTVDDEEGNFEGDDPPTTAEPLGDHHPRMLSPSADDAFGEDAQPTMIDPQFLGARPKPSLDPYARSDENRATVDLGPAARQVVGEPPLAGPTLLDPPRSWSPMPPVGGLRSSEQATMPVSPVAINASQASHAFDPHAPLDDSSRTVRWEGSRVSPLEAAASASPRTSAPSGSQRVLSSSQPPPRPVGPSVPPPFVSRHNAPTAPTAPPPFRGAQSSPQTGSPTALPPPAHVPPQFPFGPPRPNPPPPSFAAQPYPTHYPPAPHASADPMRAISMKTPQETDGAHPSRPVPQVRLRAMSEVAQTPRHGMGHLAPPHDPRDARSRRMQDLVIWGSVVVITASLVTLVIWFLAR